VKVGMRNPPSCAVVAVHTRLDSVPLQDALACGDGHDALKAIVAVLSVPQKIQAGVETP
jgi:hypothetical protein